MKATAGSFRRPDAKAITGVSGALEVLLKKRFIKRSDRILIFNTGAAQKYPEAVSEQLPSIDIRQPIDWSQI